VTDTVAVANYRTRLEADLAARFLDAAGIPYVINSSEGMLYGPLGVGATILVRAADAQVARETLLLESEPGSPRGAVLVARLPESDAPAAVETLRAGGVAPLLRAEAGQVEIWVRRDQADRATRLLDMRRRSGA
jgi:hypothetical protein